MGRRLQVREFRSDARQAVARQAVARTARARAAPARAVERARVVVAALEGRMIEEIAAEPRLLARHGLPVGAPLRGSGTGWLGGPPRRGGRPRTEAGEQVGAIVATVATVATAPTAPTAPTQPET
jgi:hypothetical protein